MNTHNLLRPLPALFACSMLTAVGCSGSCDAPSAPPSAAPPTTNPTAYSQTDTPSQTTPSPMTLDGNFSDWTGTNTAFADERTLHISFSPKAENLAAIQAAPYTTRIRIDTDLNAKTGHPMEWMTLNASIQQPQGVDLLIELSPQNDLGSIGIGSQVTRYSESGDAESIGHAAIGFAFLPTYESPTYELRINRLAEGADILPESGKIEIVIDQIDENNRFLWSTTIVADLPALGSKPNAQTLIPAKPDSSVRVMSANVLFSSPLEKPAPFARVHNAINPDVILYQEWFETPVAQVRSWLNTHATADSGSNDSGTTWTVHMPNEKAGVAIATRLPIITTYESVIPHSGTGRPARAVAALIDTPAGELLAISVHLKCCGSANSSEDNKRIAQATAINSFIREVHQKHPDAKVVIAGDFNLVGSRTPLETMSNALGINGEDLSTVEASQLANQSMVTWNDEKSRFSPGRLDWMLIDESMSTAANSFILNTRWLSQSSLDAMNLQADDSKASDHLPIVIDLVDAN